MVKCWLHWLAFFEFINVDAPLVGVSEGANDDVDNDVALRYITLRSPQRHVVIKITFVELGCGL